jgi:hypothetical protein
MSVDRPVDRVRGALERLGRRIIDDRGDEFYAQCPAHADRTPSLHVSTGEDGRALLHCFADCDLAPIIAALDLPRGFADLFVTPGPRTTPLSSPRTTPLESPAVEENYPLDVDVDLDGEGDVEREGDGSPLASVAPLRRMLLEHDAGRLEPEFEVHLPTGRLPKQARTLRALADRIALAMGYHLRMGGTRPLPVSGSFAVWLVGRDPVLDKREGRRLLDALVERGVLRECEPLPSRGRRRGTRTFEPADRTLAEIFELGDGAPVQRVPEAVEVPLQPSAELADEPTMDGAVPDGRDHVGMVAAGNGALPGDGSEVPRPILAHEPKPTPVLGADPCAGTDEEEREEAIVQFFKDECDAVEVES